MMRPYRPVSYALKGSSYCLSKAIVKGSYIFTFGVRLVCRNARQAVCLIVLFSLLSTSMPAAPQRIMGLVSDMSMSLKFWFYQSGWDSTLKRTISSREKPDGKTQEKQKDRDARVARIEIFPGAP
jgi:hypothetical protein